MKDQSDIQTPFKLHHPVDSTGVQQIKVKQYLLLLLDSILIQNIFFKFV